MAKLDDISEKENAVVVEPDDASKADEGVGSVRERTVETLTRPETKTSRISEQDLKEALSDDAHMPLMERYAILTQVMEEELAKPRSLATKGSEGLVSLEDLASFISEKMVIERLIKNIILYTFCIPFCVKISIETFLDEVRSLKESGGLNAVENALPLMKLELPQEEEFFSRIDFLSRFFGESVYPDHFFSEEEIYIIRELQRRRAGAELNKATP